MECLEAINSTLTMLAAWAGVAAACAAGIFAYKTYCEQSKQVVAQEKQLEIALEQQKIVNQQHARSLAVSAMEERQRSPFWALWLKIDADKMEALDWEGELREFSGDQILLNRDSVSQALGKTLRSEGETRAVILLYNKRSENVILEAAVEQMMPEVPRNAAEFLRVRSLRGDNGYPQNIPGDLVAISFDMPRQEEGRSTTFWFRITFETQDGFIGQHIYELQTEPVWFFRSEPRAFDRLVHDF